MNLSVVFSNRHPPHRSPVTRQTLRAGRTAPPLFLRYLCYLLFEIRISDCLLFHVRMDPDQANLEERDPGRSNRSSSPAVGAVASLSNGAWLIGETQSLGTEGNVGKRRIRDLLMLGFFALIITPGDGGQ